MIRCVRLWTGPDLGSHVQIGRIETTKGRHEDLVSAAMGAQRVTLAGTLAFSTRDGEEFTLGPGDILLAEDTVGTGHQWRLQGGDPWRRMYVVLADGVEVPFIAD